MKKPISGFPAIPPEASVPHIPVDFLGDVRAFNKKFGLEEPEKPACPSVELHQFRYKFMREELLEWDDSVVAHRIGFTEEAKTAELANQLDALVDLVYVVLGTVLLQGMGDVFEEAWSRVQTANMAKVRVANASESKRGSALDMVKPPGWKAPDHTDLVR